jgi:hypothetical protein
MNKIKRPIIALAGKAQVGKDTAAIILADIFRAERFAFALTVTKACALDLGVTHTFFLSLPKIKMLPTGITKRKFMQNKGRQLRAADPFCMVNQMHKRLLTGSSTAIITDVRMPQEAAYIREQGGLIIHIKRAHAQQAPRDVTEQHLDVEPGDYIINNTSTKASYELDIHSLALTIISKAANPKKVA